MSRILAVDDDFDILELLRDLLTDEGHDVALCSEPVLNLPVSQGPKPDLIILDYLFHGQPCGWTLLQALRQNAVTAQIPIVICTIAPRIQPEMQDYLDRMGIEVIVKPFHVDDLVRGINDALKLATACQPLPQEHAVGKAG